jgi:hypothetical protein
MKKQFAMFALAVAAISFTSCGGGWTEESKADMKSTCTSLQEIVYPNDAKAICDCYVDKLAAQFPNADFSQEQAGVVLEECSADAKKKAEEEMNKKMDEMINSMGDGTEAAPAEAAPSEPAAH